MRVALIDYGSGNLRSAEKSLARAAQDLDSSVEVLVTSDPDVVAGADRVVLPGVGAFADCKAGLAALPGMLDALQDFAQVRARPLLCICVGMQLFAERGLEFDVTPGLGWISGDVAVLEPDDKSLKIPHMGWNSLAIQGLRHPVFNGLDTRAGDSLPYVYFVHSFAITRTQTDTVQATTTYGGEIIAAVAQGNIFGTQFHPEKSQATGLKLLQNFLQWKP
jgi:glutamine amidotransferase